jgi:hypothetical protein
MKIDSGRVHSDTGATHTDDIKKRNLIQKQINWHHWVYKQWRNESFWEAQISNCPGAAQCNLNQLVCLLWHPESKARNPLQHTRSRWFLYNTLLILSKLSCFNTNWRYLTSKPVNSLKWTHKCWRWNLSNAVNLCYFDTFWLRFFRFSLFYGQS